MEPATADCTTDLAVPTAVLRFTLEEQAKAECGDERNDDEGYAREEETAVVEGFGEEEDTRTDEGFEEGEECFCL